MNEQEVLEHFRQYYQYKNMDNETAKNRVNELFPKIVLNDRAAFNEALCIIREKVYFNVCKKLSATSFASLEHVDDAMQYASVEYTKKSITNFDSFAGDNFYAYSLKFFDNWFLNYIRRHYKKVASIETELDEKENIEKNKMNKYKMNKANPEQKHMDKEQDWFKKECIQCFIQVLEASEIVPYQLITYCYASILPLILKNHCGIKELLKWINKLNVPDREKTSWADLDTGEIGGMITRKSKYLVDWAINAMYKKNVEYLSQEFTDIYNIRPLAGVSFVWGNEFIKALSMSAPSKYEVDTVGELVITDKSDKDAIKNWPSRVFKVLLYETSVKIMEDTELAEFAVEYAEDLLAKKKGGAYAFRK